MSRNLGVGKKSPTSFLKKSLCTRDLLPAHKIFIEKTVNSTWYNLKSSAHKFLTMPTFPKTIRIQEQCAYSSFLLFKISQKLKTFLKITDTAFLVIPSTSHKQKIRNIWLWLLELKFLKKLIFQYKRLDFFVINKAIISITKILCHIDFSLVYQAR